MDKIPDITLGSVGRCIYCHTRRERLYEEHIVPYGLNGPWKLLRASCQRCGGITSGFERAVLKTTFDTMRIALNFPSRRKSERPQHLPLRIERENKQEVVYVPVKDYPAVIGMPHFEPPAHLDGRGDERLRLVGMSGIQIGGPSIVDVGRKLSAQSVFTDVKFEPVGAFARMLAKIAYGFAVVAARCDFGLFEEVYVLPAILGKSEDVGRWVGGSTDDQLIAMNDLHHLKLGLVDGEILVYVKLFAQYGAPEYVVVVGRTPKKSLAELGLPKGAYWIY